MTLDRKGVVAPGAGERESAKTEADCALKLLGAPALAAADTGHTAIAAARARTNRYAEREATIHQTTYALGSCKLLHRKPWLAYNCSYVIHGLGDQCHDVLTVAVVRQKNGVYNATAKKWSSSAVGAPC